MKLKNNENGYALLMVLILVLIFTTLGMGLLSMNMNASKQFNLKEDQVQARHQAEMGVLHYGAVLEDKVKSLSTVPLNCSDIEKLLGTSKKITASNYIVGPSNSSGTSCVPLENGKLLEITIESKGIINGEIEKEVKATFYAANKTVSSTSPPVGGVIVSPPLPNSTDTEVKTILTMKKDYESFAGNLIINTKLDIGGGNSDTLKVHKDLYIVGDIGIQNHACISAGGNFTALKPFNWGHSHTNILVRKDAYLPSSIGGWKNKHTNLYVYGNLYLPSTHSYNSGQNLFVGGKVYQYKNNKYEQISNPFQKIGSKQIDAINKLACYIPRAEEIKPNTPNWVLEDDTIVDYQ